ncbi:Phosphoribosylformimino-5-aminoimidazole carboxamide ribotide isomerase [Kickxella alabastrina]|uniref:Phosphoribosylformimino-5-aminoimidazole carboxamide ribotide isomerase n=1 Tax=Kickxella alabastrina TaxID=61397 RepID=UPI00221F2521|nr:Phosphoribosylformimino-5-aminoimidazole carboxamide ribotide isomerase [Kickxella alabastrina]KAI7831047.1 Phosphoribosylformimino-5-aminoimidazole carboxamide ribotide isomerase [Kickxella alabastrina]
MHSLFRPCIDLHNGQVKQIVGGTLHDTNASTLQTNFVSDQPASYYAQLYRQHGLQGGHVGGGITLENAREWIDRGASKVIVTSWLFPDGRFSEERLRQLASEVGRERLVVDLSCRRVGDGWVVAMDRWQTLTDMRVDAAALLSLAAFCSEFLVHAADVEGLCGGIDVELVRCLGEWSPVPVTYAGGAASIGDLGLVSRVSQARVDLTIGSALDIFGGDKIRFDQCVAWNKTGRLD